MILQQFQDQRRHFPMEKIGSGALHEACKNGNVTIAADLIAYGGIRTLFVPDGIGKLPFHHLKLDQQGEKIGEIFSNSLVGRNNNFKFHPDDINQKIRKSVSRRRKRKPAPTETGKYFIK